jgi:membrane-associated PAP2 superfamily phosphatase
MDRLTRRGGDTRGVGIDAAVILGGAIAVSLVCVFAHLDMTLARAFHAPHRPELRDVGNAIAGYSFALAAAAMLWLAVPALRQRFPLTSRSAGVFVMTLVIAVMGIITNLKIARDRPRPSEVVQFGGDYAYQPPFGDEACACKSFPSTAAGFGYLVATPFFVLRRRRPRGARAFLIVGLAWGTYVGYVRMAANMHWLTDIVWSAAFVLITASVLSRVSVRWAADEP